MGKYEALWSSQSNAHWRVVWVRARTSVEIVLAMALWGRGSERRDVRSSYKTQHNFSVSTAALPQPPLLSWSGLATDELHEKPTIYRDDFAIRENSKMICLLLTTTYYYLLLTLAPTFQSNWIFFQVMTKRLDLLKLFTMKNVSFKRVLCAVRLASLA